MNYCLKQTLATFPYVLAIVEIIVENSDIHRSVSIIGRSSSIPVTGSNKLVPEPIDLAIEIFSFHPQICGGKSGRCETVVGLSHKIPPSSPFSRRRGAWSTAALEAETSS
jgi:hypothetical protein